MGIKRLPSLNESITLLRRREVMKRLLNTLAVVSAFALAPAAHAATFVPGTSNFTVSPGVGGTFTADIGNSGIAAGTFQDLFQFTLPTSGLGSGSISTSTSVLLSTTDTDFTSVLINGTAATLTTLNGGITQFASATSVPITAGQLNTLTVNGLSRGNGSYGGQISFTPNSAVPEPGTWAMMLLGFGGMGMAMRRRRRTSLIAQAA
jgi:hypothetical protein